jgi:hypothetical protein
MKVFDASLSSRTAFFAVEAPLLSTASKQAGN